MVPVDFSKAFDTVGRTGLHTYMTEQYVAALYNIPVTEFTVFLVISSSPTVNSLSQQQQLS